MNRDQITDFRSAIKLDYESKINELRNEMNEALSMLDKLEAKLCSLRGNEQTTLPNIPDYQPAPVRIISIKSIPERMTDALNKMLGEFTRQQLFEEILADGNPIVSTTSIAPVFSKFINDGKIVTVTKNVGKQAGTYRKATIEDQGSLV